MRQAVTQDAVVHLFDPQYRHTPRGLETKAVCGVNVVLGPTREWNEARVVGVSEVLAPEDVSDCEGCHAS